jgi:hypothetical protein
MKSNEIAVGNYYFARHNGKKIKVHVLREEGKSGYVVLNLSTGRELTFKSSRKFLSLTQLGPREDYPKARVTTVERSAASAKKVEGIYTWLGDEVAQRGGPPGAPKTQTLVKFYPAGVGASFRRPGESFSDGVACPVRLHTASGQYIIYASCFAVPPHFEPYLVLLGEDFEGLSGASSKPMGKYTWDGPGAHRYAMEHGLSVRLPRMSIRVLFREPGTFHESGEPTPRPAGVMCAITAGVASIDTNCWEVPAEFEQFLKKQ